MEKFPTSSSTANKVSANVSTTVSNGASTSISTTAMVSLLRNHLPEAHADIAIEPSTRIWELDLDSLGLLEWVYELEANFECEFSDSQLESLHHITTVGDMAGLLYTAMADKPHSEKNP